MSSILPLQLKSLTQDSGKLFEVQKRLSDAGFKAWLAGGCVRDALLGRTPKDFDLVTDASVDQIRSLFPKTVEVGAVFGVVLVVQDGEEFEVAQFRKESDYKDGRHPSLIEAATPEEDAKRRDLTVNALFYDPQNQTLYDFVDGMKDLQARVLKAVGSAKIRLQEDHLRILRAVRFKAQLEFSWDSELEKALRDQVGLLTKVSRERIREELMKMTLSAGFSDVLDFLVEAQVNATILPDLAWKKGSRVQVVDQSNEESVWWDWGLWAVRSGNSVEQVKGAFHSLKLSRTEMKSLQNFLFWFDDPESWQKLSLGALAEKSFQPGTREGFYLWNRLFPGWSNEARLLEIFRRFPQAPAPWIRAEDLPKLRGPELGKALKDLYHRQLEGLDQSPEQALVRYKS